jgi:hypothetical protein
MNHLQKELYPNWNYIIPNIHKPIQINVFDDGLEKYKYNDNNWIIFGKWQGKIALYNAQEPNIIIKSISSWKISI